MCHQCGRPNYSTKFMKSSTWICFQCETNNMKWMRRCTHCFMTSSFSRRRFMEKRKRGGGISTWTCGCGCDGIRANFSMCPGCYLPRSPRRRHDNNTESSMEDESIKWRCPFCHSVCDSSDMMCGRCRIPQDVAERSIHHHHGSKKNVVPRGVGDATGPRSCTKGKGGRSTCVVRKEGTSIAHDDERRWGRCFPHKRSARRLTSMGTVVEIHAKRKSRIIIAHRRLP